MGETLNSKSKSPAPTKDNPKVFLIKKEFEITLKEWYEEEEGWVTEKMVKINGEPIEFSGDWGRLQDIAENLKRKIEILQYVELDSTYDEVVKEIYIEIAKLLYKLQFKYRW